MKFLGFLHFYTNHGSLSSGFCPPPRDGLLRTCRLSNLPRTYSQTSADPVLEPPIITVNTVLSLLAIDYPTHKLACYVSDDGCLLLTFYSLVEASKFAKLRLQFFNKYNVHVRAPSRYFLQYTSSDHRENSFEFKQEWEKMKDEYGQLSRKIEDAAHNITGDELAVFSNVTEAKNHSTIVKADNSIELDFYF
ncbi:hypothetical protein EZV62_020652 [Acer yangbiense]|uniref:Uncharacterized protein n=1 Tax=Acer yangbiense TaxID=1000413 RepID=A0A5C7HGQ9_9ROSI|nr:hypothetical protein EZV62_020652 [Acer yangbiense]